MPNGNGVSGVRGDALYHPAGDQISEVKKFTFNPSQETKDYASNKTGGAKKRVSATKDASGTLEGVWDPWDPITDHMEPGTEVVLKLQHYTGQFWLVPAIIDDMSFDVDIETGDVQAWTANFSLNGPWTKPTALPTTTTTTTAAPFMTDFEQATALRPARSGNPSGVNNPGQPGPQGEPEQPDGWPKARAQGAMPAKQPAQQPGRPAMDEATMHRLAEMVAGMLQGQPQGAGK
jgi:hypothetical protein